MDKAEQMHRRALEIDEQLGRREGMAIAHRNLGEIYKARGELDEARRLWALARDLFSGVGVVSQVEQTQGLLAELAAE